jgi:curli biogenesis system outer membrane secretion channel CsgG
MRWRNLWTLTAAIGLLAAPLAAQDTRPGIAVLPFDNGGSYGQAKENFEALQQGIPAMLISELSHNTAARLVDRRDINQLLSEQNLATQGRVDAATAAKVGKLVGARYVIMGSFIDFYGDFRVDARIVDVETSEILKVVSARKDRSKLFEIIQTVATQVMADTKLPPLSNEQAAAMKRTVPTDALTYYSRALLYQDQGDNDKAKVYFSKALESFPDYTEAKEGLKKVSAPS